MTTAADLQAKIVIGDADLERLNSAVNDPPGTWTTEDGTIVDNLRQRLQDVGENPFTAAEIKTLYESNPDTNAFTNAHESKLDGIEVGATTDQTPSEIKISYESNANTNAFTDAEKSKLDALQSGAEPNPTAIEIKASYESNPNTNAFTDANLSTLNSLAAGSTENQFADYTGGPIADATGDSAFGKVFYGPDNGHVVVALDDNGFGDGFNVVGTDAASDEVYDVSYMKASGGGLTWREAQVAIRFSSRAEFVTWVATKPVIANVVAFVVSGNNVMSFKRIGGNFISDLPGWAPIPSNGTLTLEHWAENTTPGTTDMTTAVQDMWDYCLPRGITPQAGHGDEVVAISDTLVVNTTNKPRSLPTFAYLHGRFKPTAASGVWGDQLDGYSKPLVHIDQAFEIDVSMLHLDANWQASCLLIEDNENTIIGGSFVAQRWRVRSDDLSYGVRTKTKSGQLAINPGAVARQYFFGDPNFDHQDFRTGYAWKMETADFMMFGALGYYCKYPFHKSGEGSWQMIGCHNFNGALQTVTDASEIYSAYIEEPSRGLVTNFYSDNGKFYINADDLGGTFSPGFTISDFYGHETVNNDADFAMEIHTTIADNDLKGLAMSNVSLFTEADLVLTTSGSGSFASFLTPRLSHVTDKEGEHLNALGASNSFSQSMRLRFANMELVSADDDYNIQARKGLTIDVDYDNNSGTTESEFNVTSDGNQRLSVQPNGVKVSALFGYGSAITRTISSGAITVFETNVLVDTEGGAGSDTLETINGGDDGDIIMISTVSSSRDVTVSNGTGNIFCGVNRLLDTLSDVMVLKKRGPDWHMVSLANN